MVKLYMNLYYYTTKEVNYNLDSNNELFQIFMEETSSQIDGFIKLLLKVEYDSNNKSVVDGLFRIAHSLKGSMSSLGYFKTSELTHNMENILQFVRDNSLQISRKFLDILFVSHSFIEKNFNSIKNSSKEDQSLNSQIDKTIEKLNFELEIFKNTESQKENQNIENYVLEPSIKESFLKEIEDLLLKSSFIVSEMEDQDGNSEIVCEFFRNVHMLKSYANFIEEKQIDVIANKSEKLLNALIQGNFKITREIIDILKETCNYIKALVSNSKEFENTDFKENFHNHCKLLDLIVKNYQLSKLESKEEEKKEIPQDRYIRIPCEKLDNLSECLNDFYSTQIILSGHATLDSKLDTVRSSLLKLGKVIRNMQSICQKSTNVPFRQITTEIIKRAKNLAHENEKEIKLVFEGTETLIERLKLEKIKVFINRIIEYIILNSIENKAERINNDKSLVSQIFISINKNYERLEVELIEDGNGMYDEEKLKIVLQDILHSTDETIKVQTLEKNKKIKLELIDESEVVDGMLTEIGKYSFIIPTIYIKRIVTISQQQVIKMASNERCLKIEDEFVDILKLNEKINTYSNNRKSDKRLMIILEKERVKKAIEIDKVLERREFVTKYVSDELNKLEFARRVSVIRNGNVACVLEVPKLII